LEKLISITSAGWPSAQAKFTNLPSPKRYILLGFVLLFFCSFVLSIYSVTKGLTSTQDDVSASLVSDYGIEVFAIRGEDKNTYYEHIKKTLEISPQITLDDGAVTIMSANLTASLTGRTL